MTNEQNIAFGKCLCETVTWRNHIKNMHIEISIV
jgi:hypothetical protein